MFVPVTISCQKPLSRRLSPKSSTYGALYDVDSCVSPPTPFGAIAYSRAGEPAKKSISPLSAAHVGANSARLGVWVSCISPLPLSFTT